MPDSLQELCRSRFARKSFECRLKIEPLYKDGVLPKPANYAFPNLLTFHNAPTVVEQKLFVMFLEHRMHAFQGTFHPSPDYALWYGWSEMQRDLTEIRELSVQMRREHAAAQAKPAAANGVD